MQDETDMNAEPQCFSDTSAAPPIEWAEGELALPRDFTLDSGAALGDATLAWQCVGPAEAPLVVVLGGISAHRRALARDGRGWWQAQCGEGKALDARRYRLLSIDWLGGCGRSTGPHGSRSGEAGEASSANPGGSGFPSVSTADQARALLLLLNRLGVRRVHLLVGASYGGNVAQHLAALLDERVRHLVLFSAAHRASQFGLALRHVQRSILDLGESSDEALALARALAVLGYRSAEGIEHRFGGEPARDSHPGGVLAWLDHHGETFARRFDADAYRCLGRSLDAHVIDPAALRVPTTIFAVHEDLTVPPSLLHEYRSRAGGVCELVEISSLYGHDAFLKEEAVVAEVLTKCLENPA